MWAGWRGAEAGAGALKRLEGAEEGRRCRRSMEACQQQRRRPAAAAAVVAAAGDRRRSAAAPVQLLVVPVGQVRSLCIVFSVFRRATYSLVSPAGCKLVAWRRQDAGGRTKSGWSSHSNLRTGAPGAMADCEHTSTECQDAIALWLQGTQCSLGTGHGAEGASLKWPTEGEQETKSVQVAQSLAAGTACLVRGAGRRRLGCSLRRGWCFAGRRGTLGCWLCRRWLGQWARPV